MAGTEKYQSLYAEAEVTLAEYREELVRAVAGRIEDFDPKHPMRGRDLRLGMKRAIQEVDLLEWQRLNLDERYEKYRRANFSNTHADLKLGQGFGNRVPIGYMAKHVMFAINVILGKYCGFGKDTASAYLAGNEAERRREISTKAFAKIVGGVTAFLVDYRNKKDGTDKTAAPVYRRYVACALMGLAETDSYEQETKNAGRTAKILCVAAMASMLSEEELDFLMRAAEHAGATSNSRWQTHNDIEILRGTYTWDGGGIKEILESLENSDNPAHRDYYQRHLTDEYHPVYGTDGEFIGFEDVRVSHGINLNEYFGLLSLAASEGNEELAKALFDVLPSGNRVLTRLSDK